MTNSPLFRKSFVTSVIAGALCASAWHAKAAPYVQTDLVSDIPGLAAITDAQLVNPWGIAFSSSGSPFWISNQGANTSTLYSVPTLNPTTVSKVNINAPSGFVGFPAGTPPLGPTGVVSNINTSSFLVSGPNSPASHFIFGDLNGAIYAWAAGPTTTNEVMTPGAAYTGLAIGNVGATTYLYAANNAGAGSIDVFDGTFANVGGTTFAGKFTDPSLPAGYAPFNVQTIGGNLYVTYAPAGRAAEIAATPGEGYVDEFDTSGNFVKRVVSNSALAAPWGIALAPAGFGVFGGDLLVGNFSYVDSEINAFDPSSGAFEGTIPINVGGNNPGGLWALTFGNTGSDGNPNTLYFDDGLNSETAGLFGAISAISEPPSLILLGTGLGLFGMWRAIPAAGRLLVFRAARPGRSRIISRALADRLEKGTP
jgi:uncharacterized protein (TIGR03118 family)